MIPLSLPDKPFFAMIEYEPICSRFAVRSRYASRLYSQMLQGVLGVGQESWNANKVLSVDVWFEPVKTQAMIIPSKASLALLLRFVEVSGVRLFLLM